MTGLGSFDQIAFGIYMTTDLLHCSHEIIDFQPTTVSYFDIVTFIARVLIDWNKSELWYPSRNGPAIV